MYQRFFRALSAEEATAIEHSGRIEMNRDDWQSPGNEVGHPCGTVVFLVRAEHNRAIDCLRTVSEKVLDERTAAAVLRLVADLPVEADESGWASLGAVVHRGPIELSGVEYEIRRFGTMEEFDEIIRDGFFA